MRSLSSCSGSCSGVESSSSEAEGWRLIDNGEEFDEEEDEEEEDTGMMETVGRCCCSTTSSNLTDLVLRLEEDSE